jgi:hypothetical protein
LISWKPLDLLEASWEPLAVGLAEETPHPLNRSLSPILMAEPATSRGIPSENSCVEERHHRGKFMRRGDGSAPSSAGRCAQRMTNRLVTSHCGSRPNELRWRPLVIPGRELALAGPESITHVPAKAGNGLGLWIPGSPHAAKFTQAA